MPAEPAISETIYQELRRRLLAGAFKLRQRLDVGRIATDMHASATPVREALARLATEGLIAAKPTRGFFATLWTEVQLAELYQWRASLIQIAVEARFNALAPAKLRTDYSDRVRHLFESIEEGANTELRRAAANADDRLHAARRVEAEILSGTAGELSAIAAAGTKRELLSMLRRYHARRLANVGAIRERAVLRALPNNGE